MHRCFHVLLACLVSVSGVLHVVEAAAEEESFLRGLFPGFDEPLDDLLELDREERRLEKEADAIAAAWLGKWSGASSYEQSHDIFRWHFTVLASCDGFRVGTHTSGPEKVEVLNIDSRNLEFLFHDDLKTHITISLTGDDIYTGTVEQPNNLGLPKGQVDGRRLERTPLITKTIQQCPPDSPIAQKPATVDPAPEQPKEEEPIVRYVINVDGRITPVDQMPHFIPVHVEVFFPEPPESGATRTIEVNAGGQKLSLPARQVGPRTFRSLDPLIFKPDYVSVGL
ncbi:MAG: hypothetical protein AAGI88_00125 [Pseudomonadota bacterium]